MLRSFTIVFEFFFVVGLKYLLEIKVRFFKVASLNSNELKSDQTKNIVVPGSDTFELDDSQDILLDSFVLIMEALP